MNSPHDKRSIKPPGSRQCVRCGARAHVHVLAPKRQNGGWFCPVHLQEEYPHLAAMAAAVIARLRAEQGQEALSQ